MIEDTIPTTTAQQFYDRIGKAYDWFELFEAHAKTRAQELLDLQPGLRLLNVGMGTGKQHKDLQAAILPSGTAFGIDISLKMIQIAKKHAVTLLSQADAGLLPFPQASFDRLYASYLMDLIPMMEITTVLCQFRRVIKPGGRMVLLALTEGITPASRLLVGLWKLLFHISPVSCGGCRPLELSTLVMDAGYTLISREVVIQFALPSEIIVAQVNSS